MQLGRGGCDGIARQLPGADRSKSSQAFRTPCSIRVARKRSKNLLAIPDSGNTLTVITSVALSFAYQLTYGYQLLRGMWRRCRSDTTTAPSPPPPSVQAAIASVGPGRARPCASSCGLQRAHMYPIPMHSHFHACVRCVHKRKVIRWRGTEGLGTARLGLDPEWRMLFWASAAPSPSQALHREGLLT